MLSWIMCVISLSMIYVKSVQGEETEFITTKMTCQVGFEYCLLTYNMRLMYMMSDFSTLETDRLLYFKNVSVSLDESELIFWTAHRVNNQTTIGERFYTESPVQTFMYDNELILCVYYVYERYNNRLGWEADNCYEKEKYFICTDRVSSFHLYDDFREVTQFDEHMVWNESKRYCYPGNDTIIDPTRFPIFELTFFSFLWRELNIAGNTLLANTSWKGLKFLKEVKSIVPGIGKDYDCEYAESKLDKSSYIFEWSMKSCHEPLQGYMCENISEKIIFFKLSNYTVTNKIQLKRMGASKPYKCEEECLILREAVGAYCVGFTYYLSLQECVILGQSSTAFTRPYYHFEKAEGISAYILLFGKMQIGDFKQFFELDALTANDTTGVRNNGNIGQVGGIIKDQQGKIHTITVSMIGAIASAVILYHFSPIMQGLQQLVSKSTGEAITQKEVEDHVSDTVAITMPDIDVEKLFAKRIEICSVPPISHIDFVS